MDVDLRELRYFVAVADELHFSRAATRLHLDQPTLSRHVRRLENQLGVMLLERTTRSVTLTAAGAAFLEKARETLTSADAAAEAARRAAAGQTGVLRVGMMAQVANDLRMRVFSAFQERHPDVELRPMSYPFADPSCGLASAATDVAFAWLPLAHPQIQAEVLFEEPRLFVLAKTHPLSKRPALSIDEVAHEPFFELESDHDQPLVAAWNDFWQLQPRSDGVRRPIGAVVANEEEWLDALARGLAISTTAISAAKFYPWPGIAYVDAVDIPPAKVALAWRSDRQSHLVENFVALVDELQSDHSTDRDSAGIADASDLLVAASSAFPRPSQARRPESRR